MDLFDGEGVLGTGLVLSTSDSHPYAISHGRIGPSSLHSGRGGGISIVGRGVFMFVVAIHLVVVPVTVAMIVVVIAGGSGRQSRNQQQTQDLPGSHLRFLSLRMQ
jgi:hypothetical protein